MKRLFSLVALALVVLMPMQAKTQWTLAGNVYDVDT